MFTHPVNKLTPHRRIRVLLGASVSLVMLLGTFTISAHGRQGSAQVQDWSPQLQADIAVLDSFLVTRDLDALEIVINRASAKWQKRGRQPFVEYMFRAGSLLSSYRLGDQSRQALLLSGYAISVLTSGDLSLRERVQFVEFLTQDPLAADEATWQQLREKKARLWLEAWRDIAGSMDPKFDFEDLPVLKVRPPATTGLPAGVAPEAINDLKLRAEYENAIAQNSAKVKRYNDQSWLKLNAPSFFKEVERYLVNAYARPPADVPELERLLTEYVDSEDVRRRVMDAVRREQK